MIARLIPLLTVFALLACGTPAQKTQSITEIQRSDRVVMAPLNLALRMPAEIDAVQAPVWDALIDYFATRDRTVRQIDPADAQGLWSSVVIEMGEARELTGATSSFARELAEHSDYDLLVMPALVMRRATVRGHHAYWDGVRRRIQVDAAWDGTLDEIGRAGDNTAVRGLNGQLAGASLYVAVLTPDGSVIYEGLGGLDLLHEAEHARTDKRGEWRVVLRDAPFATPDHLEEGIRVALERKLRNTARAW